MAAGDKVIGTECSKKALFLLRLSYHEIFMLTSACALLSVGYVLRKSLLNQYNTAISVMMQKLVSLCQQLISVLK